MDVLGDTMFNYPVMEMVKMHMNQNYFPMWFFTISYTNSQTLEPIWEMVDQLGHNSLSQLRPELRDATHGVEMSLMFPKLVSLLGPLTDDETEVTIVTLF